MKNKSELTVELKSKGIRKLDLWGGGVVQKLVTLGYAYDPLALTPDGWELWKRLMASSYRPSDKGIRKYVKCCGFVNREERASLVELLREFRDKKNIL